MHFCSSKNLCYNASFALILSFGSLHSICFIKSFASTLTVVKISWSNLTTAYRISYLIYISPTPLKGCSPHNRQKNMVPRAQTSPGGPYTLQFLVTVQEFISSKISGAVKEVSGPNLARKERDLDSAQTGGKSMIFEICPFFSSGNIKILSGLIFLCDNPFSSKAARPYNNKCMRGLTVFSSLKIEEFSAVIDFL